MSLPTPYYHENGITIYNGDCRDILPQLPKVDLVLTDPPYTGLSGGVKFPEGKSLGNRFTDSRTVGNLWQASHDWIPLIKDKAEIAIMSFCGYKEICQVKQAFGLDGWLITWYIRNSSPSLNNAPHFMNEFLWCFKLGQASWRTIKTTYDIQKLNAGCAGSPERIRNKDGLTAAHPTQKPLELIKNLMLPECHTILDPFVGSGTTLRAAKDLGRQCIGIELEEKYCAIAVERLRQEVLAF